MMRMNTIKKSKTPVLLFPVEVMVLYKPFSPVPSSVASWKLAVVHGTVQGNTLKWQQTLCLWFPSTALGRSKWKKYLCMYIYVHIHLDEYILKHIHVMFLPAQYLEPRKKLIGSELAVFLYRSKWEYRWLKGSGRLWV